MHHMLSLNYMLYNPFRISWKAKYTGKSKKSQTTVRSKKNITSKHELKIQIASRQCASKHEYFFAIHSLSVGKLKLQREKTLQYKALYVVYP